MTTNEYKKKLEDSIEEYKKNERLVLELDMNNDMISTKELYEGAAVFCDCEVCDE